MLPVAAEDNDLEQVVFTVRPTMIFIKLGYALAVIGAIALVVLLALIHIPVSYLHTAGINPAPDSGLLPSPAKHGAVYIDRLKN